MAQGVLDSAKQFLKCRKFAKAIDLLLSREESFSDSFEYNILLAIAYLYIDDRGNALKFIKRARTIRLTDRKLLLTQGAFFLRQGKTDKAISYYLEVLDGDPNNKTAKAAIDFLKDNDDYDTICQWTDDKRIWKFYPPLGANPIKVLILAATVAGGLMAGIIVAFIFISQFIKSNVEWHPLGSQEDLRLTREDMKQEVASVVNSYEQARKYFDEELDNHARHEINIVLLNSVDEKVKSKAEMLKTFLRDSTYESIFNNNGRDNFSIKEVVPKVQNFFGCYVIWSGKITNLTTVRDPATGQDATQFNLVIGSEDSKRIDAIVLVKFRDVQKIDDEKSIEVFGKVCDNESVVTVEALSFR